MSYDGFGSSDYLSADFGSGQSDGPLTLVAWVKLTAAQWAAGGNDACLNYGGNASSKDNSFWLGSDSDPDEIAGSIRTTGASTAHASFTNGTFDDEWVVLALRAVGTSDDDRDVFVGSTTITAHSGAARTIGDLLRYVRVGGLLDGGNIPPFLIAEVALFDIALSDAQINELMTAAETGPAPNTVASANCTAYWPLDTDQATHTDQSGNGGPSLSEQGSVTFNADHPTITAASSSPSPIIEIYHRFILAGES